jgi:hypothetical protein
VNEGALLVDPMCGSFTESHADQSFRDVSVDSTIWIRGPGADLGHVFNKVRSAVTCSALITYLILSLAPVV